MDQNRLTTALTEARRLNRKCLMPYVTAGYPTIETTTKLLRRLDAAGCQAVEVGFPFSDSIADGPVIQDSFHRALDGGFRVNDLLDAVGELRESVSMGLIAMVSMSMVRRIGVDAFAKMATKAGFDGLIVPDVPVDECRDLAEAARSQNLCNILMAAPATSKKRRVLIAENSTGFVYLIAAKGITGERDDLADDLSESIKDMRSAGDLPVMVGFGIGDAQQVREVCRMADGAIVGSALIRRITACVERSNTSDQIADTIGAFVDDLMTGTTE